MFRLSSRSGNTLTSLTRSHGGRPVLERLVLTYNPVTNTWKRAASLPMPWSSLHCDTLAVNGKILIVGGQTNGGYDGIYLTNIDEFNSATNSWAQVGSLPEPNEGQSDAVIDNELIVVNGTVDNVGGWAQDETLINSQISL